MRRRVRREKVKSIQEGVKGGSGAGQQTTAILHIIIKTAVTRLSLDQTSNNA